MVVKTQKAEPAQAKAIVDGAEKAQRKAQRKAFCRTVDIQRRGTMKARTAEEKLKKELCKEVRAKAQAKRLGIFV